MSSIKMVPKIPVIRLHKHIASLANIVWEDRLIIVFNPRIQTYRVESDESIVLLRYEVFITNKLRHHGFSD